MKPKKKVRRVTAWGLVRAPLRAEKYAADLITEYGVCTTRREALARKERSWFGVELRKITIEWEE